MLGCLTGPQGERICSPSRCLLEESLPTNFFVTEGVFMLFGILKNAAYPVFILFPACFFVICKLHHVLLYRAFDVIVYGNLAM